MNRLRFKEHWRREASARPPQVVFSMRKNDRLVDGVVIPGAEFIVWSSRRRRPKR